MNLNRRILSVWIVIFISIGVESILTTTKTGSGTAEGLTASGSQQFIPWGYRCQKSFGGSHDKCEEAKGIVCLASKRAHYCGCRVSQSYKLSYDPVSKECRRQVGEQCQQGITATTEEKSSKLTASSGRYDSLCHVNAECKKETSDIEAGAAGVKIEKHSYVCRCNPGYEATRDLTLCEYQKSSWTIFWDWITDKLTGDD